MLINHFFLGYLIFKLTLAKFDFDLGYILQNVYGFVDIYSESLKSTLRGVKHPVSFGNLQQLKSKYNF